MTLTIKTIGAFDSVIDNEILDSSWINH